MDQLKKLMEKKKGQELDPTYKNAKMSMLKALHDEMSGMMRDDLAGAKGMKHVEVEGSDPDALAAGLDKAKEMVGNSPDADGATDEDEGSDDDTDAANMISNMIDHEGGEGELSPEKIDMLISLLEKKKMEMGGGKI